MLTVINLYTIDKIFNEDAEFKLSPTAKMLYINCLTHHFKEKKPTVLGAVAFSIFINDIRDYHKFERLFQELHKAGLVIIGTTEIQFQNHWGKHIDRSKLDKVSPEEYVAGFSFELASKYKEEILGHTSLFELTQMKHKVSKKQIEDLLDLFVKEQDTFGKKYNGFSDCVKHFTYWIPNNLSKTQNENVKTGAKVLGLKRKI